MLRFSRFRTIRTAGRALSPRPARRSRRPNFETLEDRSVPAHLTIVVGSVNDLTAAISQSNADASHNLTTANNPDVIQWASTPIAFSGTMNNTGNLEIDGDFAVVFDSVNNLFAILDNTGSLHVTGNVTLDDQSLLNNGLTTTDAASLTVDGALALGNSGNIDNWGTSSISVAGELSFGTDATVYNGGTNIDIANASAAVSISAASLVMGSDTLVYNEGASAISVSGNFTLGDGASQYYGGLTDTAATSLTVGGNYSIGDTAFTFTYGHSTIAVTGDFALGSNGILENGIFDTDATSLTVGGNFTIGHPGDGPFVSGDIINTGDSTIAVSHNFTVYGDEGSVVENGTTDTDAALMTVGGQFSMGANSQFLEYGTQSFQTKDFALGANSSFGDYGAMIVTGHFDAGAGNGSPNDISGLFRAGTASTVTTNTSVWEVQAGGVLDIAGGASFSIPVGGTLAVDAGGAVTVEGHVIIDGIVDPPTFTVRGNGLVTVDAGGSLTVGDLVLADSGEVDNSGTLDTGTVTLTDSGHLVQEPGSTSMVATPADQQITFQPLANQTAGTTSLTVSASANSGLPVSYSIVAGGAYASIAGNTVTISASAPVGTVITVEADQSGDANFNAASPVDQSFTITGAAGKLNQTIMFGPLANVTYGTGSFTLSASATSFLAVSFAVVSGGSYASVSGNTVTILGATPVGSQVTIEASQAGDSTYNAATSVDQSFTIGKASQSIAFASLPNKTFGNADFTLGATSDSGLPVSYSIVAGAGYASISGNTVHLLGATPAGTVVTIEADQAGNGNYDAATSVDESFSVSKALQSIAFGALPNKTSSDPDFAISATASSGLPVTFTASGSATVSLVSGTWKVHITGTGSATITAHQAGSANYSAAADVPQSFTISAPGQTVTVPSGQQYTFTDPNGNSVSIKATGGATTTLSLQTVSGTRKQLSSLAVTGATSATNLTISASGATTINNLTIAGSGIHDINLAGVTVNGFSSSVPMHDLIVGSLQGSIQLTGGGQDLAIGSIGTASGPAAVTLSGGFHNVVFGLVLSGSSFTLVGAANDLVFGDVAAGATLSLGTSSQTAVVQNFVGGAISGSLLVNDSFQIGAVLSISGHVYLKSIGGAFITASRAAGPWVGADLALAGGGDILLGTISNKSKVITL